jgi:Protein of unknown function (DUF3365)
MRQRRHSNLPSRFATAAGTASAFALAAWCVAVAPALGQDDKAAIAQRADHARAATAAYAERLKIQIVKSLKADGPIGAIAACNTMVPELADSLAQETSFEIMRTSSKVRNADNAPDAWEQEVLEKFSTQIGRGADAAKLEHYEVTVTKEGQKFFRYMKPIMTGEVCLTCHGTEVKPELKSEIAKYYPDDKALGYRLGDMRGAFSLFQQME